jgi:hypothetical protein
MHRMGDAWSVSSRMHGYLCVGVRLEDVGSGKDTSSVWKLDDIDVLRKERAMKLEAQKEKEAAKLEAARKQQERLEKSKINPADMYRGMTTLYSAFDEVRTPIYARIYMYIFARSLHWRRFDNGMRRIFSVERNPHHGCCW